ncbi:MAG: magnesium transporter [Nitrosomonas sp.]|nr:MAG: magnesium transporter [Nitrosomonas sp.]
MTEATDNDNNTPDSPTPLQQITYLLRKYKLIEGLVNLQDLQDRSLSGSSVQKQNLDELKDYLNQLHPADIAHVLEALPMEDRLLIWSMVNAEHDGEVLLETSDAVRATLITDMGNQELIAATEYLDTDEIADLAPDLPKIVIDDVFRSLPIEEREQLRAAMSYPEDSVGALMDFDVITIREDIRLEVVLRYLRRLEELPDHTDQLFVVDRNEQLKGVLLINRLLVSDPETLVADVMTEEMIKLHPGDVAQQAANAFERYDLVSASVVDDADKLLGRVTVNTVIDFIRDKAENEALNLGGLSEEEDIFASVLKSVKNRWGWLAINLITAFIASRVIGLFEDSIEKLVALAALMPIVAGIGGNSGNQTITMIVRALALEQINTGSAWKLLRKEVGVSLVNGLIWGTIIGVFTFAIYQNAELGMVMTMAMVLNLLLAAILGVLIPLTLRKLGRDPALGSSVMITAVTDSGGFFIFLGLATIFLL